MERLKKYTRQREPVQTVSLTIKMPKATSQRLDRLAQETGYSRTHIVIDLVEEGLEIVTQLKSSDGDEGAQGDGSPGPAEK